MEKPAVVEPGQVWADNDIRSAVDEFTVRIVDEKYAWCKRGEKMVRIRIDRLLAPERPTKGYRYIGKQR